MNSRDAIAALKGQANGEKATQLARFFKTGKGEYAEGDKFWGITVPTIRIVTKQFKPLPLSEVEALMVHPVHEVRLCGLLILVSQAKANPQAAASLYLKNTRHINNWDLVDLTAGHILGPIINPTDLGLLTQLATSEFLWERRIAILTTFYFIMRGNPLPTLSIARLLVHDSHDLIHKSVGWMLREVGKRCSLKMECSFLDQYGTTMPRTMLRYAIERFNEPLRHHYLSLARAAKE